MVAHQAIGQQPGVVSFQALRHHIHKEFGVRILFENQLAAITARGDVIRGTGKFDTKWAAHMTGSVHGR